tara:strand:- start:926 stop:1168 length:243 start_codon:yes stop_codon:yes gene_type:complete
MNDQDIELRDSIIKIVRDVTRCSEVDKDTSIDNLPQWDSLAYISILGEIEMKYEIEINENNINNFKSINSIFNIIRKERN